MVVYRNKSEQALFTSLNRSREFATVHHMTDDWSGAEIQEAVDAYLRMLHSELAGHKYNKAAVNRELREGVLRDRSRGSIEMRMCNISAVLDRRGLTYISGYKPRSNVGSKVTAMIEASLLKRQSPPRQTAPTVGLEDIPKSIPKECFLRAIAKIQESGYSPFGHSTTFDVIWEGRAYPPLAVVGFALEELTGKVCSPGLLRGGQGTTAFELLAEAGLTPVHKAAGATADDSELDQRVAQLHADGAVTAPPEGNLHPIRIEASSGTRLARDPGVKLWVLQQACGHCEACGQKTFPTGVAWNPWYLEVHHVIPLKEGGADTTWNAIALCPTCHRRCHSGQDRVAFTSNLLELVPRLRQS
jgi:hypothetical protein